MTRTLLAFALFASVGSAQDWNQWRGPDRSGVSRDKGLLKSWPAGGPKLLWTSAEAGIGYAAPVVVGNRIFCMGADAAREFVFALDLDGKPLWKSDVGPVFDNLWGNGPRSSPTVVDGLVHALGADGNLVCVKASDGSSVWSRHLRAELGGALMTGFGMNWGYCEGVLVDGDRVFCCPGGPKGTVAVLDRKTGATLARSTQITDAIAYSSLMPITVAGKKHFVVVAADGVYGFDADAKVLWKHVHDKKFGVWVTTPVIDGDLVYLTKGYGVGCELLRVKPAGEGLAVEVVYTNKVMINHHGGVVLLDGRIYGHTDKQGQGGSSVGRAWIAQDLRTGKLLWEDSVKLPKGAIAAADGRLYLLAERGGDCVLLEPDPAGWREAGRFTLPKQSSNRKFRGGIWTHPVVAGGRLYLRDQELLFCFDVRDPSGKDGR